MGPWIDAATLPPPLGDTRHSETVEACGWDGAVVLAYVFWHDDGPEWALDQDEGEFPELIVAWRSL